MEVTMARAAGVSGIAQINVVVHDLKKAVAFYRDTLGLTLLFEIPTSAFLDCGGVRVMLALPEPHHPELDHPPSIIYYRVDDIAAAAAALKGKGVKLEGEPHVVGQMGDKDIWIGHFYDHENNLHALTSETERRT
jgi:catechol 2,3-dioxygenase-like lactoylglutathione lyase family enzyme